MLLSKVVSLLLGRIIHNDGHCFWMMAQKVSATCFVEWGCGRKSNLV